MVKITTLIDNYAIEESSCKAEHGFSCFIEYEETRILFDTGQSDALLANAEKLGVDLSELDILILSHAHYDHTGGVVPLLTQFPYERLHLYTGRGFELGKYAQEKEGLRYLGPDFDQQYLSSKNVMWHSTCCDTVMVRKGVWLLSQFDRVHPIEGMNKRFIVDNGERVMKVDPFDDEVALVLDTPKGLVMIVGCSHPGILNMVDNLAHRFSKPLYALIGGIHLHDADEQRINIVSDTLMERDISILATSHCTGDRAVEVLKNRHQGFVENRAGTVITI
ncbi:MAG: MBL fold metallo-hydrolase [Sphaerochaetaceae bacterium]|jgi:7,8-dihydropterin-6-yl-methyl-4-(beta-D-ribofuranosyl)aminobenzene 5'-phosphate synthase